VSTRALTVAEVTTVIRQSFAAVLPAVTHRSWCLLGQLDDGTCVPLGYQQQLFSAVNALRVHLEWVALHVHLITQGKQIKQLTQNTSSF
jgi:hypothetical protein